MKVQLAAHMLTALLVASITNPVFGQQTGEERWKQVIEEIQQADKGLRSVTANVQLEQYVQRPGESEATLVIKSTGKIWCDSPRYRVELQNAVRLRANKQPNDYLDTCIEQHTIVFDGQTTCEKRTYRDGHHKKIDHGRQLDLPIRFAGFPLAEPAHLWKGPLPKNLLEDESAQVKLLSSGGLKTEFRPGNRKFCHTSFVPPGSNRIRHVKVSVSRTQDYQASCDLTWAESNGVPYVQRIVWDSPSGNSEFGNRHRTKRTIEFTNFQAGAAVVGDLFSFASLSGTAGRNQ